MDQAKVTKMEDVLVRCHGALLGVLDVVPDSAVTNQIVADIEALSPRLARLSKHRLKK